MKYLAFYQLILSSYYSGCIFLNDYLKQIMSEIVYIFQISYVLVQKITFALKSNLWRWASNDDIFRMYYTLCPQSDLFELATVMKERLLGDFSRKNLKSDNILDKVLDSEKLIDKTSRFREVSREEFSIPRRWHL